MKSSIPLFDSLADGYDETFDVPHRKLYDMIAWDLVHEVLPKKGVIVDAGCGSGRWVEKYLAMGYEVLGIEQSPKMIAELKSRFYGKRFVLVEGDMEKVEMPQVNDLVVAMGSVQYAENPGKLIQEFYRWLKPGGWACVLVDSFVGGIMELLSEGSYAWAEQCLNTWKAESTYDGITADHHLLDARTLTLMFQEAGFKRIYVHGLLILFNAIGRSRWTYAFAHKGNRIMDVERKLSQNRSLVDVGKQILVMGRK